MQKIFVTYKIAKDLEKLGFDLESFGYFWDNGKFDIGSFCDHSKRDLPIISAPLWQDVVKWFEIIHGLELITKSWKEGR